MKKAWLGTFERIQKTESSHALRGAVFNGAGCSKGTGLKNLAGNLRKPPWGVRKPQRKPPTINLGVFVPATKKLGVFVSACAFLRVCFCMLIPIRIAAQNIRERSLIGGGVSQHKVSRNTTKTLCLCLLAHLLHTVFRKTHQSLNCSLNNRIEKSCCVSASPDKRQQFFEERINT